MASDSTNQPVRNSGAWACRIQSITANVRKSNTERERPEEDHEAANEAEVPRRGPRQHLLVDVVGGDRHLASVVEQVVEQDLRREHRQELQERRRGRGAEHVPEVRRRRHQHVLDRVREDATPLDHAVGEHAEILVEQDDVGGVLGDVGARVDRDADVGVVQRDRVVHAVAHEGDVGAALALHADDARLRLRADPGEDRRRSRSPTPSSSSVIASTWAPVERAEHVQPEVGAHLGRDLRAVARDDLHEDAEAIEAGQRLGRVGLRPVDEHEEAHELEVLLVGVGDRRSARGRGGRRPRSPGRPES